MQLDSNGNVVNNERRTAMKAPKITKNMRKQFRTNARLDRELTPTKANALSKGYTYIMTVLGRGSDIRTA